MKKIIMTFGIVVLLLLSVGYVFAGSDYENQRYLVKSNNAILKMVYGVQHNFDNGFTTGLSPGQLKMLKKFGIEVEEVELYHISGKPGTLCGNGKLEPGEKCEIGYTCPSGFTCENCKCVEETASPERSCYPSNQTPWGIDMVYGDPTEHYIPSGGANIVVAVLDTGVDKDHLDLKANIINCKDTTKRGIRKGCADGNGHGTHVAGTIAADGGSDGLGIYGVAPGAKLMAIKVLDDGGSGWADDIAAGIRYAADKRANIISMSLGGETQSSLIKDAIDYATNKGVLVIAAAGNDGPADGSIDYPGANPKVVAVGAIYYKDYTETFDWSSCIDTAPNDEDVACWSSRGINDGDYTVEEKEVELAAPGVNVESTYRNGCYAYMSGTSMATPHVAGLAAKLWGDTDAATTRIKLQELAKLHDLHTEGDDTATGFGLPIVPITT